MTNIIVNPVEQTSQDSITLPWAGAQQNTPIKKSPNNVVSVECKSPSVDPTLPSQPHPFIYRVQNQVEFSPRLSTPTLPLSPPVFQLSRQTTLPTRPLHTMQDPFKKILEAADSNIHQAESILSSLGYDGFGISGQVEEEEQPVGLCSDIETNIRRLEKTQAKINAALKTFRNVRNLQSPNNPADTSFCSLPAWEPAEDEQPAPPPTAVPEESEPRKKSGIIRRHSFNNLAAKEKSPEPSSSLRRESLYDGDIDSSDPSTRNSAVFDDCSDTESHQTSPFRSRIRGLFGSFGKGKKAVSRIHSEERSSSIDKRMITIEYPDHVTSMDQGTFSIGQFTELVRSLPAHNFSSESALDSSNISAPPEGQKSPRKPTFLRPKDPPPPVKNFLCQNNSSDTYSSISTSQSFNLSSNRNSVISTQSNSSESCGPDTGSVSDAEQTESGSSPKDERIPADGMSLSKTREKKVYYIAKEVTTSEKVYVDVLRLLNIEFRDYVQRARFESKSGIMPDQDFVKLFSNLPELMMLNEDLLRDFEERISNWDDIKKIADVIIKKGPYLKLYTVYIRDFSAMNFHFDECCQRYAKFGKLVKEFEKLPRCQNLKLKHFMLKPVQRLPQYKLLLEDYLKHLATDSADFDDTTLALKIVSDAAEHANDTVKQGVRGGKAK